MWRIKEMLIAVGNSENGLPWQTAAELQVQCLRSAVYKISKPRTDSRSVSSLLALGPIHIFFPITPIGTAKEWAVFATN